MSLRVSGAGYLGFPSGARPASTGTCTVGFTFTRRADLGAESYLVYFYGSGNGWGVRINSDGDSVVLDSGAGLSSTLCTLADGESWTIFVSVTGGVATGYAYRHSDGATASVTRTLTGGTPDQLDFGGASWGWQSNGVIEGIMCWDRALSADEIALQRKYRRPVIFDSLKSWVPGVGSTTTEAARNWLGTGNPTVGGTWALEQGAPLMWGGKSIVMAGAAGPTEVSGAGAASVAFDASAVSRAIKRAVGAASFAIGANGAAQGSSRGVGAASIAFSAAATARALARAAGSASITFGGGSVGTDGSSPTTVSSSTPAVPRGGRILVRVDGVLKHFSSLEEAKDTIIKARAQEMERRRAAEAARRQAEIDEYNRRVRKPTTEERSIFSTVLRRQVDEPVDLLDLYRDD